MGKNKPKKKNKITDNVWQAFASTGEVGCYLLYKQLEEK